jgi:hypothetical protein
MFCPKCATQNMEGASFCRTCGANISLVPQAMSGQPVLSEEIDDSREGRKARRRRRRNEEPRLDSAFRNVFMGFAFLVVAIALSRTGQGWWFWMLFPAFSMMATGISQYIRVKDHERKAMLRGPNVQSLPNRDTYVPPQNLSAPGTGQLRPPVPSVTEGTTRHLGVEAPTRHFDSDPK